MTAVRPASARVPNELLTHPSEHSRLLLALSATAIVFGGFGLLLVAGAGWGGLAGLVVFCLFFAGLVWLGLQIYRARVLGNGIRVTRETVPELQEALDEVCAHLDFHGRVDVCVVQKAPHAVLMTSYLGTKVIVFEGALVADLMPRGERAQLLFLLARYIGALKAKHERLTIVYVLLEAVASLKFLFLFLLPYERATALSGDQMALRCCGDLDAALAATERLLVGKELEPEVRADGVVTQAGYVRRRVLPRLAQLFQSEPHLTNRYVNLLFHARATTPEVWEAFRRGAAAGTSDELDRLWLRSPHRRQRASRARRVVTASVVAGLTAAVLAAVGVAAFSAKEDDAYASPVDVTPLPVDTPEPVVPTVDPVVPTPDPIVPADDAVGGVGALVAHVPESFRDSCDEIAPGSADVAVDCTPLGARTPTTVQYYQFAGAGQMDADFDAYGESLPARECQDGQTTWSAGTSSGRVACFTDAIGINSMVWTDESLDILGYSETILVGPKGLFEWWLDDSGPV